MDTSYTVVIPAYNSAETIGETIESALRQSIPPARILVIDDGSTDSTRNVVEAFGGCVDVQTQPNQGPGSAMSLGMRQCETTLIAAIDADDIWLPGKIELQLNYLLRNPTCNGVFTRMQHFGETGDTDMIQDGWTRSTMLIRREVYDCIGDVVDPPGCRGEMIDWLARAREAGMEFAMLPDVLVRRRVSRNSLSAGRDPKKDRGYALVAISALRRKRARLEGASNP